MEKIWWGIVSTCLILIALTSEAYAAIVDAEICISATVLDQSPFDVIDAGGSVCATGHTGSGRRTQTRRQSETGRCAAETGSGRAQSRIQTG